MLPSLGPDYAEAAAWLARLRADDRTRDDEVRFRQWLAADTINAERFEYVSTIWEDMDALRDIPRSEPAPRKLTRRRLLTGSLAACAVGGLGLQWSIATAGVYTTERGEQRRLTLDDGTRLLLNTDTSVKVRFNEEHRRIDLRRGQALFEVSADPRPFYVNAGAHDLTVQRGRFDVRREMDQLSVLAIDSVATLAQASAGKPVRIGEGERIRVDATHQVAHDRPNLNDVMAWQSGNAVFRGESLAQVITEMNRYTERELVLVDDRAAALHISGVYRVGDNGAFARSLAKLLPIKVEVTDRSIRISAI